jgi:hypothetical protein
MSEPNAAKAVDVDSQWFWKSKYEELCLDLQTWGVAEIAVRNLAVMEYMRHWEGRAEKAEADVERLRTLLIRAGLSPD